MSTGETATTTNTGTTTSRASAGVCVCPEFSTVHIIYLYTQYSCSVQSYEVQLSNLSMALSKMESTVRKEKEEKVE